MGIIGALIGAIISGTIIGALGRLVVPGTKNMGFFMTVLLGIAGALFGTIIYALFGGTDTPGIDWIRLLVQVLVAAVFVFVYTRFVKKPM
jgi:uncharacterized membrane protein YeaQ/YmgE (transglycosylase-associated protein family)